MLFILVIAMVLLSFLPVVNFFFQLCFDTTTAAAAFAAGKPELETNASGNNGRTIVGDRLLSGVSAFASAADRNKVRLPRRRRAGAATAATAANSAGGESETGRLLQDTLLAAPQRDLDERSDRRPRGLGGAIRALRNRALAPLGYQMHVPVSPPTPPITPEAVEVHVERPSPLSEAPEGRGGGGGGGGGGGESATGALYRTLSRQGVRMEHGVPL